MSHARQVRLGSEPVPMTCPHCRENIITYIVVKPTARTQLCSVLLGVCGLSFFCCCLGIIPYLMDDCKGRIHKCPRCGNYIGIYNAFE